MADSGSGAEVVDLDEERRAADESQLSILDSGRPISFAEYRGAVQRSVSCMRDAGIDVVGDSDIDRSRGFPLIAYSFAGSSEGRSGDETLAVADDCMARFSILVEGEYQTQPTSVEAIEAEFQKKRPQIIECLAREGRKLSSEAPRADIEVAQLDVASAQGVDCFAEAGFAG